MSRKPELFNQPHGLRTSRSLRVPRSTSELNSALVNTNCDPHFAASLYWTSRWKPITCLTTARHKHQNSNATQSQRSLDRKQESEKKQNQTKAAQGCREFLVWSPSAPLGRPDTTWRRRPGKHQQVKGHRSQELNVCEFRKHFQHQLWLEND